MKGCLLVIPLKPFAQAKVRLSAALDSGERERFARALFLRTEQFFVRRFATLPRLVVTAQPRFATLCHTGTQILHEERICGLNAAAEQARTFACRQGFAQMLMVSADVALWREAEVEDLLHAGKQQDVVIARAHDGGSNALLLRLPAENFHFAYGAHSARAHQKNAGFAGLSCKTLDLPLLAHDLDTPADLLLWQVKQNRSQVLL